VEQSEARLGLTLRGIVFSIRPSLARSLGQRSELEDLLTTDGLLAWKVGLQVLATEAEKTDSAMSARLREWVTCELDAEMARRATFHILAEAIESRLTVATCDTRWTATAANVHTFQERSGRGESMLTFDVAQRLRSASAAIARIADANSHESVGRLLTSLAAVDSLACHATPEVPPTSIVDPRFADDLRRWSRGA
jgi:hypothetical protein